MHNLDTRQGFRGKIWGGYACIKYCGAGVAWLGVGVCDEGMVYALFDIIKLSLLLTAPTISLFDHMTTQRTVYTATTMNLMEYVVTVKLKQAEILFCAFQDGHNNSSFDTLKPF